jgi:hypothetical protein
MKIPHCLLGATHLGTELDLLLFVRGRRIAVECKRAGAPMLTASMRIALDVLKLNVLFVVYSGKDLAAEGIRD